MSSCQFWQSAELPVQPVLPAFGIGTYSLAIPNNTSLVGLSVFLQGFAAAPGANALGVIASNGLQWLIGAGASAARRYARCSTGTGRRAGRPCSGDPAVQHTSTEALRARMRDRVRASAPSAPDSSSTSQVDGNRELLQALADAGGRHTFAGIDHDALSQAAYVGFELRRRGLATVSLDFAGTPARIEKVVIELTEKGRAAAGT